MHMMLYGIILVITLVFQFFLYYKYEDFKDARPMFLIAIMLFLFLLANSHYIELPYVVSGYYAANATNITLNYTADVHVYREYGLGAIYLGFILLDVIMLFAIQFDILGRKKKRL